MSNIPASKKMSKPKSMSGDDELSTPEHDKLLGYVWSSIDDILKFGFIVKPELLASDRESAISRYRDHLEEEEHRFREVAAGGREDYECMRVWRAGGDAADDGIVNKPDAPIASLIAAADRYRALRESENYPPLPEFGYVVDVNRKNFQYPLTVQKASRDTIVGFVDIMAEVELYDGLTFEADSIFSIKELSGEEVGKLPAPPEWKVETDYAQFYIDVRVTLPPAGVLLRELKTLRELLPEDATILLIGEEIPAEVERILWNEGIRSLDVDQIMAALCMSAESSNKTASP